MARTRQTLPPGPASVAVFRIVIATLVIAVAGCTDDEKADGSDLPEVVEAMWAVDDPVVAVEPPAKTYLPANGLDAAPLQVRDLVLPADALDPDIDPLGQPSELRLQEAIEGAVTLYADPASPEPGRDRGLAVGRTRMHDISGHLVGGNHPYNRVTIQGSEGKIYRLPADTWAVVWPLDLPPEQSCGCDRDGFVVTRGLGRVATLAAAEVAVVEGDRPSVPDAHHSDLRSLGTMPYPLGDSTIGAAAQVMVVELPVDDTDSPEPDTDNGPSDPWINIVDADVRALAHHRFWAPEGEVVVGWGGWHRRAYPLPGDEAIAVVDFNGDLAAAHLDAAWASIDQMVDSLVAENDGPDAAFEEIARRPLEVCGPDAQEGQDIGDDGFNMPDNSALMEGTVADARWQAEAGYHDGFLRLCTAVAVHGGSLFPDASNGGNAHEIDTGSTLEVLAVRGEGTEHLIVVGHAAAGLAVRIDSLTDDVPPDEAVEAVVGGDGPVEGRRWFAAVVGATPAEGRTGLGDPLVEAIAFDDSGAEVGRVTSGGR